MMFLRATLIATVMAGVVVGQVEDCGPAAATAGNLTIAGSSTVEPVAKSWATGYMAKCAGAFVNVTGGGTSVGAGRVCGQASRGSAVDIGTMSRNWRLGAPGVTPEASTTDNINYQCIIGNATRKVKQIAVALDGISIAMVAGGLGSQCIRKVGGLTTGQLRWMYSNFTDAQLASTGFVASTELPNQDVNATSRNWDEIDARCPKSNIVISGPDSLSGTQDFFREAILTAGISESITTARSGGYFNSADDKVLVQFVETSSEQTYGDAVCYFGFSYYLAEGAFLYGSPIKNTAGVLVAPTRTNIEDDSYNPLGRRIFMNVLDTPDSLLKSLPYIKFGLSNTGTQFTEDSGLVPLPLAQRTLNLQKIGLAEPVDVAPVRPTPVLPAIPIDNWVPPKKLCGLLGFNIFCLTGCGLIGRILNLCRD